MKKASIFILSFLTLSLSLFAQNNTKNDTVTKDEGYRFTIVKEIPITSVKDQNRAGTCWCYSGIGLLEAELLRMGKGEYDFSEMYIAHKTYDDRARAAIRMHGDVSFSQGGSFYDVIYGMSHYGLVPDSEMPAGAAYGDTLSDHTELSVITEAMVNGIVKSKLHKLQSKDQEMLWEKAVKAVHDIYLGACPKNFTYKGKTYTPMEFYQSTGLNADDYVSLTSYTHHPFYEKFSLEIQDNWRQAQSYNLPIDELMQVFDNAIENGYTIAWGADVSEPGWLRGKMAGIAVLPDIQAQSQDLTGSDMAHWLGLSSADRAKEAQNKPTPQRWVTQEQRQEAFDNWETTDDHGMLIYGIAKDQTGNTYYMVKNSWGDYGQYHGMLYASKAFVRYKTMNILVNKKAIPKNIAKKLGIK